MEMNQPTIEQRQAILNVVRAQHEQAHDRIAVLEAEIHRLVAEGKQMQVAKESLRDT